MRELRIPKESDPDRKKGTITVDIDTAIIIRRIAAKEGRSRKLTPLVEDMIQAYLSVKHPDWKLVGSSSKRS